MVLLLVQGPHLENHWHGGWGLSEFGLTSVEFKHPPWDEVWRFRGLRAVTGILKVGDYSSEMTQHSHYFTKHIYWISQFHPWLTLQRKGIHFVFCIPQSQVLEFSEN